METKERLVGLSPAIEQAIELAIYRKNESTYEAYVKRHDAQFRILTWAVGLILALGLGIGAFFFHKDFSAFSKAAENEIAEAKDNAIETIERQAQSTLDTLQPQLEQTGSLAFEAAFDEQLAEQIRAKLADLPPLEKIIEPPKGTIVAWLRDGDAPAPLGWILCDGQGACPDLRGKYLVGASLIEEEGKSVGARHAVRALRFVEERRKREGEYALSVPRDYRDKSVDLRPPSIAVVYIMKL